MIKKVLVFFVIVFFYSKLVLAQEQPVSVEIVSFERNGNSVNFSFLLKNKLSVNEPLIVKYKLMEGVNVKSFYYEQITVANETLLHKSIQVPATLSEGAFLKITARSLAKEYNSYESVAVQQVPQASFFIINSATKITDVFDDTVSFINFYVNYFFGSIKSIFTGGWQ